MCDQVESLRPSDAGSDKPPPPLVHTATDFSTNGNGDIASGDDNALIERVNPEEGTLTEEVGTSGEEEDFGEFTASDSAVTGNLLLTWMRRKEAVLFALVGHHLFQKQYIVALQWLNELLARCVEQYTQCFILGT